LIDHPYKYGGTDRILELQSEARYRGFEFHVIVNSEIGGVSDEVFTRRSYQYFIEQQGSDSNSADTP